MPIFKSLSPCPLSTLYRQFTICSTFLLLIGIEIHVAHPNRLAVSDRTCTITDGRHIFCWPLERTDEGGIAFSDLSLDDDTIDSISASDTHVCVVTTSGKARCALLVGLSSFENKASLFEGLWLHGPMHEDVRQICAGSFFTCAILKSVNQHYQRPLTLPEWLMASMGNE